MIDYLQALDEIVSDVIAENADAVDGDGRFPRASLDALSQVGFLGLISATEVGGMGMGLESAVRVVERIAEECGSTAMVVCMHYSATAVIEKFGPAEIRRDIAAGTHLSTLAFSEKGSRSQFWAPVGTASRKDGTNYLNAQKSWVTSAHQADSYVWSSRPVSGDGASTIWLVPRASPGLTIDGQFNGLGLRGNDSTPVTATDVTVEDGARLGEDGAGLDVMLQTVLPCFNVLISATAVGLMRGAVKASTAHARDTRFEHSGSTLADLPTLRAQLAKMQIATDAARCLVYDTVEAIESDRSDAQLRVLECKAAASDTATQVTDMAMRVSGGAAFRRELGVERRFRDARAGSVMAPTSDHLYDFIGKAICGMPVFG